MICIIYCSIYCNIYCNIYCKSAIIQYPFLLDPSLTIISIEAKYVIFMFTHTFTHLHINAFKYWLHIVADLSLSNRLFKIHTFANKRISLSLSHTPHFAFFSCPSIFYPITITPGFTPVSGSQ